MFDQFWEVYPRKVCKKPAQQAWKSAIKRCDPLTIISAARRYAESRKGQDQTFTCHAATWLRQDRWEDWPAPQARLPQQNNDLWIISWINAGHYAPWVSDHWVRKMIASGVIVKEAAMKAGHLI